jgi:hypothetical protein
MNQYDLETLTRLDPLMFAPLNKIMIARTVIERDAPRIPIEEIGQKVNYIIDLSNELPLKVHEDDIRMIRNALQEHLLYGDRDLNIDFMSTIDRLARDNWNHTIEAFMKQSNASVETSLGRQGGRKKRKTRKYKK